MSNVFINLPEERKSLEEVPEGGESSEVIKASGPGREVGKSVIGGSSWKLDGAQ